MLEMIPYDRLAAVRYAHRWAFGRNPRFYDYSEIGGDCTNFASQCLYAGTGVMDFTPTFGWYYRSANDKAPAWTGVPYFFDYVTRPRVTPGPFGIAAPMGMMEIGDFVQLRFPGQEEFGHTPIIVELGQPLSLDTILVAAHSEDADWRPLSTYRFDEIRYIHILGAYRPEGQERSGGSVTHPR